MKGTANKVLESIASLCLCVAVMAAGTASFWGGYQPEEPDFKFYKF